MARYKHIDASPSFVAVDLEQQVLPSTFDYALSHLVDHKLDLSRFNDRFRNDVSGSPAHPLAMRLKVILFAYGQGIVNNRGHQARLPPTRHHYCPVRRQPPQRSTRTL
jgi:hypothetical protein